MTSESNTVKALLIDLDGVIYQSGRIIPGALETLDWLDQQGISHMFVTNTTSCSHRDLLQKFSDLGFEARANELVTPVTAANQWIQQRNLHSAALFVADPALVDFEGLDSVALEQERPVDVVVIGDLGEKWNYDTLNRAFRFLNQDPAPALLALGMTRYWQSDDGLCLDVAPFVHALEYASGVEAVVVGKPAAAFFDSALALLGCHAGDTLMIGDDIGSDIDAAQQCHIRGIQVKTGKFREADLKGGIHPYAVIDSIADLPQWWLSEQPRLIPEGSV